MVEVRHQTHPTTQPVTVALSVLSTLITVAVAPGSPAFEHKTVEHIVVVVQSQADLLEVVLAL